VGYVAKTLELCPALDASNDEGTTDLASGLRIWLAGSRPEERGRGVMRSGGIGTLIYVVIGAFVAGAHHYFKHVDTLKPILSALLAIFLWPLILLGINLHIH
jgi:hypothetical protein